MTEVLSPPAVVTSSPKPASAGEHRHLCQVSGVWYIRAMVHGRRISESTQVADLDQARRIRDARLAEEVISHITGRPCAPASGRAHTPLIEVVDAYRTAATVRGMPPTTVDCYVSSLRTILRRAGQDLETATANVLTAATVRAYIAASPLDTKRGRVTARSTLHQARGLFAKWTREQDVYRGLSLPDLQGFLTAGEIRHHGEVSAYVPRPADLVARTKLAAEDLPANLKAVWYLAYGLALRAGEIVDARWDWVAPDGDGRPCLHVMNRQDTTRKGSLPRAIPIPEKALAHLQALRAGDYLLPADTPSARQELIDWTNAWMRRQGWTFAEYSKGIHELRKLRGCEWFTQINPAYASKMLGHKSLTVTQQYYACYTKGHDALPC